MLVHQQKLVDLQTATKQHVQHLPEDIEFHKRFQGRAVHMRQWKDQILACTIDSCDSQLRGEFDWPEGSDRQIAALLSQEQLWNKWNYQMAFPHLAKFLAKTSLNEKSLSQIYYESFFPSGEKVDQWSSSEGRARRRILDHKKMWDHVKRRIVAGASDRTGRVGGCLPSRLLHIIDLSPIVAAILLGSTPT